MFTYVLWRLTDNGWKAIKGVISDKIACCANHEKILGIGKRP